MLRQRLLVSIVIIPLLVGMVSLGGWFFAGWIALMLGYAAWEYWRMFSAGNFHPSPAILIAGAVSLAIARKGFAASNYDLLVTFFILAAMAWQIIQFERGSQTAAVDLGVTLGGIFYLGWLGGFLVSLRELPNGMWWILTVIPAINLSDAGAYFIGSHFGRHKLTRRVSPTKSWEGYLGGVITGALGAALLASLWHLAAPAVTAEKGLIIGLVVSIFSPLGDLGESMLKRNFGVKDSSQLLPGHGGIFDRIDSWLWAAPIGYFLIHTFWI